jgi:hypothetical protein
MQFAVCNALRATPKLCEMLNKVSPLFTVYVFTQPAGGAHTTRVLAVDVVALNINGGTYKVVLGKSESTKRQLTARNSSGLAL